jgi:hypothetical protein
LIVEEIYGVTGFKLEGDFLCLLSTCLLKRFARRLCAGCSFLMYLCHHRSSCETPLHSWTAVMLIGLEATANENDAATLTFLLFHTLKSANEKEPFSRTLLQGHRGPREYISRPADKLPRHHIVRTTRHAHGCLLERSEPPIVKVVCLRKRSNSPSRTLSAQPRQCPHRPSSTS